MIKTNRRTILLKQISKDIDLTTTNSLDLTDTYRTLYMTMAGIFAIFMTHVMFTKIDHMLRHK